MIDMRWRRTLRRRARRHRRSCYPGHRCFQHADQMSHAELLDFNTKMIERETCTSF